jgi:hypothetical protein
MPEKLSHYRKRVRRMTREALEDMRGKVRARFIDLEQLFRGVIRQHTGAEPREGQDVLELFAQCYGSTRDAYRAAARAMLNEGVTLKQYTNEELKGIVPGTVAFLLYDEMLCGG